MKGELQHLQMLTYKNYFKAKTEKSEGLECQCQSEPKAKAMSAYVGKTLI